MTIFIHPHNLYLSHDKAPPGFLRWFIYSIEDVPCQQRIVGSTTNPYNRWSNYKSHCNKKNSNSTGLSKHFKEGCPNDTGLSKSTLDFTLLDYYDTTNEKLILANHVPGPKCRCLECEKLKNVEDFWIMKLGTFYEGFNTRDEVKAKSRYNWKWTRRGVISHLHVLFNNFWGKGGGVLFTLKTSKFINTPPPNVSIHNFYFFI